MTFCIIFYEKMPQAEQAEASLTASHVVARKLACCVEHYILPSLNLVCTVAKF